MTVQKTIHAFLPPKRLSFMRSINGAHAHFKAQGRNIAATKMPICSRESPAVRMIATMAIDVKPYGIPSDIYISPKVRNRPLVLSSKFL